MNGSARRGEIRDLLQVRPIAVAELAERYGVSESTIRRDLTTLSESGQIVRTYGGALSHATGEEQAGVSGGRETAWPRSSPSTVAAIVPG